MDPYLGGSIINAGASIIGNAFGMSQVNKSNQFALDMYNRQNEYNSPKAQIGRMREAGLNPALMYGSGSAGGGMAAPAPQREKQSLDVSAFANVVQTYLALKKQDTAIQGMEKDNRSKEANAILDEFNTGISGTREYSDNGQDFYAPAMYSKLLDIEGKRADNVNKEFQPRLNLAAEKNMLQDLATKKQALKMAQLKEWIPEEEWRRFKEYGIYPDDSDVMQTIKMIFGKEDLPKSLGFLKTILTGIMSLKGGGKSKGPNPTRNMGKYGTMEWTPKGGWKYVNQE